MILNNETLFFPTIGLSFFFLYNQLKMMQHILKHKRQSQHCKKLLLKKLKPRKRLASEKSLEKLFSHFASGLSVEVVSLIVIKPNSF